MCILETGTGNGEQAHIYYGSEISELNGRKVTNSDRVFLNFDAGSQERVIRAGGDGSGGG